MKKSNIIQLLIVLLVGFAGGWFAFKYFQVQPPNDLTELKERHRQELLRKDSIYKAVLKDKIRLNVQYDSLTTVSQRRLNQIRELIKVKNEQIITDINDNTLQQNIDLFARFTEGD